MQYANVPAPWLDMSSKVIMTEILYTYAYLLGKDLWMPPSGDEGTSTKLPTSQNSDDSCVPGPLPIQSSGFLFSISPFAKKTSDVLSGPSPPSFSPHNWVQCVLNREALQ